MRLLQSQCTISLHDRRSLFFKLFLVLFFRDIKPENILIFDDWTLRLADFGSAHFLNASDHPVQQQQQPDSRPSNSPDDDAGGIFGADQPGSATSVEYCGTPLYLAPEVSHHLPYAPMSADVWSTGIVTFTLLMGAPPFYKSEVECWYFRCVQEGNWGAFWHRHERSSPGADPLPDLVKDFLQRALDPNPNTRETAKTLLQHPWFAPTSSAGNPGVPLPSTQIEIAAFMEKLGSNSSTKPVQQKSGL